MKRTWSLTQESFDELLTWLDSNREEAAAKYESIRHRLIRYFVWNGCGDQDEELTDKTFDRVAKKLEVGEVPEPFTGDKALYFLAFASNIRREHHNRVKRLPPDPVIIVTERVEDEDVCLEKCKRILPDEDRSLADKYYHCEKTTKIEHHKMLAKSCGLTMAGLRTRMHRIRERLRPCIEECLDQQEG